MRTLHDYLPLVIYEDEMLPEEQRHGRFLSMLLGDSGARSNYTCGCDATALRHGLRVRTVALETGVEQPRALRPRQMKIVLGTAG